MMHFKKYINLVAAMLLVQLSYAQSKIATVSIKTAIYCDHCKQCESCAPRIEKAAFAAKGIKRVEIDEKTKTVTVTYNTEKTSPEKIRQAIADAGFDADDVKGNATAYAKWDDCCKK
ncbi:MAG: heavy-metal-associated domain-containing protein [Flavipsychrobacter sp.]|nr:heavy-metal-associated domain-containing protein [Flavipsychrobacter sp.]